MTQTPAETTPPTPNPMAFDPNGLPRKLDGGAGTVRLLRRYDGGHGHRRQRRGPVLLRGRDYPGVSPNGFSSGWINAPTCRVHLGGQNAAYEFRVKARDATGNETGWSAMPIRYGSAAGNLGAGRAELM